MWICRAGKDASYINQVKEYGMIRLFWDGYGKDYTEVIDLKEFRNIVEAERGQFNKITISNWAAQLHAFCCEMKLNDYVLIPYYKAQSYMLVRIIGKYEYHEKESFPHVRRVEIIKESIPKRIFPQDVIYSLNAFRTIYRVKKEDFILEIIEQYREG